jgi:hypothetical protein
MASNSARAMSAEVEPIDLERTARAVASNFGDRGAVIISLGEKGVRVGAQGLTPEELRYALCVAINFSFVLEDEATDK